MFISRRFIKPFCAAALALFLLAPSAANAVVTPAQYCATVSGQELLNVEVAASTTNLNRAVALYTLHCCLNGTYKVVTFYSDPIGYNDPFFTSASCH